MALTRSALKKGHGHYVTIISGRSKAGQLYVLDVIDGRSKKSVASFLSSIPAHIQRTVTTVCTDMYDGFVNAAIDVFGIQSVVIDRYHVSKLYRQPLDTLRINEMARLKGTLDKTEYAKLQGMMWILRKKHECLSESDKTSLQVLYTHSPALKKAHRQALKLTQIFNTHSSRRSGIAKINRWITSVEKEGLSYFKSVVKTLRKYLPTIANYFKGRKNSGFVEGLNNKIKVLKRRCYGLSNITSVFQRMFLDLQGYECYA